MLPKNDNNVSVCLSVSPSAARTVSLSEIRVIYVDVADSAGEKHSTSITITGTDEPASGTIDNIALGMAHITAMAFGDDDETPLLSAVTNHEIVAGENQIELTLQVYSTSEDDENQDPPAPPENHDFTITFKIDGTVLSTLNAKDEPVLADFTFSDEIAEYEEDTVRNPFEKKFAFWQDQFGNSYTFESESDVTALTSTITADLVISAKFGIKYQNLESYLQDADTWGNIPTGTLTEEQKAYVADLKDIVLIKDETATENILPGFNDRHENATGITLDFSDCTNFTRITSQSSFNDTSEKWVDVLILPASMTEIDYIKGVKDDVYIKLPSTQSILTLGNSVTGENSSYRLHFNGTVADWCQRVTQIEGGETHYHDTGIFYHMLADSNNTTAFYALNSARSDEVLIMKRSDTTTFATDVLDIESTYLDYDGTKKTLTTINPYAFNLLQCNTIKIPDSVTTIGDKAFLNSYATEVYIGSGVNSIGSGALFYSNLTTTGGDYSTSEYSNFPNPDNNNSYRDYRANQYRRSVYYNGTILDFLKITTHADGTTQEGGPLHGACKFYVKQPGASTYTDAVDASTKNLVINLGRNDTVAFDGHFEGFKETYNLVITGTGKYTIENYAFYKNSGLTGVDIIPPSSSFSSSAFSEDNAITNVHVYGAQSEYCGNNPFQSSTSYLLYVPSSMSNDYPSGWSLDATRVNTYRAVFFKVAGVTAAVWNIGDAHSASDVPVSCVEEYEHDTSLNPGGKVFVEWRKSGTTFNPATDLASLSSLTQDAVISAKFGVYFDNLAGFLNNSSVWDAISDQPGSSAEEEMINDLKDIIVLKGESTTKTIPAYSSKRSKATGLTLDFTDCTQLTGMNSNVFKDTTNKWVNVVKLPNSLTTIAGLAGVKDAVYIALPVILDSKGAYQSTKPSFDSYNGDANTTYKLHFAGTAADWGSRFTFSTNQSNHPLGHAAGFYVLNDSGEEIAIWDGDTKGSLNVNSTLTNYKGETVNLTGTGSTNSINAYAFRWCQCSEIHIPDTVTKINNDASFSLTTATKVYFGNQITNLYKGTFFYTGSAERTVYYKGTLTEWMAISCAAGKDPADAPDGGPLMGASDLQVWNSSTRSYSKVLKNETVDGAARTGVMTISVDSSHQLKGHVEGLKRLEVLKIDGTVQSLPDYAFFRCEQLADVYLDIGNESLTENSNIFTCYSTNTFLGLTGVKVHVPDVLLSKYAQNTNWQTLITNGVVILENKSHSQTLESSSIDAYLESLQSGS